MRWRQLIIGHLIALPAHSANNKKRSTDFLYGHQEHHINNPHFYNGVVFAIHLMPIALQRTETRRREKKQKEITNARLPIEQRKFSRIYRILSMADRRSAINFN